MLERSHTLALLGETWSTPAVVRASYGPLIVAADREGAVHAFDGAGTVRWQRRLGSCITSSPIVADIEDEGRDSIAIGTHEGAMFLLNADTGATIASASIGGMIRAVPAFASLDGARAALFVAAYGPSMTALDGRAKPIWSRNLSKHLFVGGTKRGIVSSPLVHDVNGDGRNEIVFGTRSARVFCLDAASGAVVWFTQLHYDCDSSPSFALVNGTPLVLLGGGEHTAGDGENALIAINGYDGSIVWRCVVGGGIDCAPTIAHLESGRSVAIVCSLATASCLAVEVANGRILWRHNLGPSVFCSHDDDGICRYAPSAAYFTAYAICRSYTTPLVADIDGDGRPEVVIGSNNGLLLVLDVETGIRKWSENTYGMVRGSPILSDLDGDGRAELIVPSGDELLVYRTRTAQEWSQFKGEPAHRGTVFDSSAAIPAPGPRPVAIGPRMFLAFVLRDAVLWVAYKIDTHIARRLGFRMFRYHY